MPEDFDVIVVGAASAGLEAAVAAAAHGATSVAVFEKAPVVEAGGNARFSHTGFRFPYEGSAEIRQFLPKLDAAEFDRLVFPPYSAAEFLEDIRRVSDGESDEAMSQMLAGGANEAVHWMRTMGIRWAPNRGVRGADGRLHLERGLPLQAGGGDGGGKAQLEDWRRLAGSLDVRFFHGSPVRGLRRTADGRIRVSVELPGGMDQVATARSVVLASGGFQASRRRREALLGPLGSAMKVRGSRHDTGEVTEYALEMGAARSGQWSGANVAPVDAHLGDEELGNRANRYSYQYGITVNTRGERFFDEGRAARSYTYAEFGWAIAEQPGSLAFQIFDATGYHHLKHYAYKYARPVVAPSVGEVAEGLSVPVEQLERTMAEFNAAVPDSPPFDPTREDGRGTRGLRVPKSNWANRLETPPYFAYPVTAGITFTYGGLKVDEHARVLDEQGAPIDGLYASGDILGIFSRNYPSGSGQTRNAVFSLAAGRHIARRR